MFKAAEETGRDLAVPLPDALWDPGFPLSTSWEALLFRCGDLSCLYPTPSLVYPFLLAEHSL